LITQKENKMQMNWKDAIEGVNVVYPEGTYRVLVKSWKPTTSKNKGTAGIVWSVGIMEPETFKNKTIFCTTWLVEAALWKLARLVNACGIDVSKMGSMDVGSKEMGAVLANTLANGGLNGFLPSVHNSAVLTVAVRAVHPASAPSAAAYIQQRQRGSLLHGCREGARRTPPTTP
jgi:hypothetical protein